MMIPLLRCQDLDSAMLLRVVAEAVQLAATRRRNRGCQAGRRGASRARMVVVDPRDVAYVQLEAGFREVYEVLHATSLLDCIELAQRQAFDVLVCTTAVNAEAERVFLKQLKQEHPHILVVTVYADAQVPDRAGRFGSAAARVPQLLRPRPDPIPKALLQAPTAQEVRRRLHGRPAGRAAALPFFSGLQRIKRLFFG